MVRIAFVDESLAVRVDQDRAGLAAIETVRREGFSRIPVFRRRITDIVDP